MRIQVGLKKSRAAYFSSPIVSNRLMLLKTVLLSMPPRFLDTIPSDVKEAPVLISGVDSRSYPLFTYLLVSVPHQQQVFLILHECRGLPFQIAMLVYNLQMVGHQEHFYLFDSAAKKKRY